MSPRMVITLVVLVCVTIFGTAVFVVNSTKSPIPHCDELYPSSGDYRDRAPQNQSRAFLEGRCR